MESGIQKMIDAWPKDVVAPAMDVNNPMVIYDLMYKMLVSGGVKRDASPGYPGLVFGKSNEDLMAFIPPETLAAIATERVLLLGEISFSTMETLSAMDMVSLGLTDPIRLFIKNEPHLLRKLEEGRCRLINSVSIIDQMVEKYLCGRQNKIEIANYTRIPSMAGMGNHVGLGGAETTKLIIEEVRSKAGTDASAYDWTNTHQTMMVDPRFRAAILDLPQWENHYTKRQLALMTSMVVVDDGSVFEQYERGVQKSGSANTSSGNSRSRAVARAIAFPNKPLVIDNKWQVRVMGDDCVENIDGCTAEELVETYSRQNLRIKLVTTDDSEGFVEFCGLEYSSKGIRNPRALKTVCQFLQTWPTEAQWGSRFMDFCEALHYCPDEMEYYGRVLITVKTMLALDELGGGEPIKQQE